MRRLLAVALLGAGCAPATTIRGTVSHAGEPVGGAQVAIRCPGQPGEIYRVDADAQGRFGIAGDGVLHPACSIHVDKPGYEPAVFALSALCAISGTIWEGCYAASVQAELEPIGGGGPEAASDDEAASP